MPETELCLRTPRLILRPFDAGDIDDAYAYMRLPEVARYLYWDARDRAQVVAALATKSGDAGRLMDGQTLTLAVQWARTGRVVGEVQMTVLSHRHRQGEVGFVFNPEVSGLGLATEAAREIMRYGFTELGLHRVIGRCDVRNAASARLMERLGMRREAHLVHSEIFKGEWGDEYVYAQLDHEWRPA
ncbi:MAG TPA: GNAT family protein [Micromonosporaceae bacterium]|nr:GNAT family protein [Micromonosporaceae bacterium]